MPPAPAPAPADAISQAVDSLLGPGQSEAGTRDKLSREYAALIEAERSGQHLPYRYPAPPVAPECRARLDALLPVSYDAVLDTRAAPEQHPPSPAALVSLAALLPGRDPVAEASDAERAAQTAEAAGLNVAAGELRAKACALTFAARALTEARAFSVEQGPRRAPRAPRRPEAYRPESDGPPLVYVLRATDAALEAVFSLSDAELVRTLIGIRERTSVRPKVRYRHPHGRRLAIPEELAARFYALRQADREFAPGDYLDAALGCTTSVAQADTTLRWRAAPEQSDALKRLWDTDRVSQADVVRAALLGYRPGGEPHRTGTKSVLLNVDVATAAQLRALRLSPAHQAAFLQIGVDAMTAAPDALPDRARPPRTDGTVLVGQDTYRAIRGLSHRFGLTPTDLVALGLRHAAEYGPGALPERRERRARALDLPLPDHPYRSAYEAVQVALGTLCAGDWTSAIAEGDGYAQCYPRGARA